MPLLIPRRTNNPAVVARLAEQFKALSDATRLSLLLSVRDAEHGDACVCDLTPGTGVGQSTVSHHLKQLVNAGLLVREQRGKWAYYRLTDDAHLLLSTADSLA